jgi:hypothetical protein
VAGDRFVLASDGTILVDFDPGYPPDRAGAEPDLLVKDMHASASTRAPPTPHSRSPNA